MSETPLQTTLEASQLTFGYSAKPVLDAVSFSACAGDLVAIVGPNGSGKSTLLRLLIGELSPTRGVVAIDGKEASHWGRAGMARRLSLVPQMGGGGAASTFGYTVREMVLMGRHASGGGSSAGSPGWLNMSFETEEDMNAAQHAMWTADVHHLGDRSIATLSGGERQRVAIARALAQQTPIMLLDEPTSALDLYHQLEVLEEQHRAVTSGSRLTLLVTHDLNIAQRYATRTLVMDRGRIVADGPTQAVLVPAVLEPVYQVKVHVDAAGRLGFDRIATAR